jgi:hypothetical protein
MARADGAPSVSFRRNRPHKLLANECITPSEFTVSREHLLDPIGIAAT